MSEPTHEGSNYSHIYFEDNELREDSDEDLKNGKHNSSNLSGLSTKTDDKQFSFLSSSHITINTPKPLKDDYVQKLRTTIDGLKLELEMWQKAYKESQTKQSNRIQSLLQEFNTREKRTREQFENQKEQIIKDITHSVHLVEKELSSFLQLLDERDVSVMVKKLTVDLSATDSSQSDDQIFIILNNLKRVLLKIFNTFCSGNKDLVQQAENALSTKESEKADLQNQLATMKHKFSIEINSLKLELSDVYSQVNQYKESNNKLSDDVSNLRTEKTQLESKNIQLSNLLQDKSSELENTRSENLILKAKVESFESDFQDEEDKRSSLQQEYRKDQEHQTNEMTDFSIVFAIDLNSFTPTSNVWLQHRDFLVFQFSNLLQQLIKTYCREQIRCQYLENELNIIAKYKEQIITSRDTHRNITLNSNTNLPDSFISRWLHTEWGLLTYIAYEKSKLLRESIKICDALRHGTPLQLRVNGWIEFSHHIEYVMRDIVEEVTRYDQVLKVRPCDACILSKAPPKNLKFESDRLEDVIKVIKSISSFKSVEDIAKESILGIDYVSSIVNNLIEWRVVRLLPCKVTRFSILVTSNSENPNENVNLKKEFEMKFGEFFTLARVLETFSISRQISVHFEYLMLNEMSAKQLKRFAKKSSKQQRELLIQLVDWLLKYELIVIKSRYVKLLHSPKQITSYALENSPDPYVVELYPTQVDASSLEKLIYGLNMDMSDEMCIKSLNILRRVYRYLDGSLTVDEIAQREKIALDELMEMISLCKSVLLLMEE